MGRRKQTEYIKGTATHRTTVRLESEFWGAIDKVAASVGLSWSEWAVAMLATRPEKTGAASWLRVQCLTQSIQGA